MAAKGRFILSLAAPLHYASISATTYSLASPGSAPRSRGRVSTALPWVVYGVLLSVFANPQPQADEPHVLGIPVRISAEARRA